MPELNPCVQEFELMTSFLQAPGLTKENGLSSFQKKRSFKRVIILCEFVTCEIPTKACKMVCIL